LRLVEGRNLPAPTPEEAATQWAQTIFNAGYLPGQDGMLPSVPGTDAAAGPQRAADPHGLHGLLAQNATGATASSAAVLVSGPGIPGLAAAASTASAAVPGAMAGGARDAERLPTADSAASPSLAEAGIGTEAAGESAKASGAPWVQVTATLHGGSGSLEAIQAQPGGALAAAADDFGAAAQQGTGSGGAPDLPMHEEGARAARRSTETSTLDVTQQIFPGEQAAGTGGERPLREQPAGSLGMAFAGRYAAGMGVAPGNASGSPAGSGFGNRGSNGEAPGRQPSPGNPQTRLNPAVTGQPVEREETDGGFAKLTTAGDGSGRAGFAVQGAERRTGTGQTAGESAPVGVEAARTELRTANGSAGSRLAPAGGASLEAGLDLEPARTHGSAAPARSVRVDLPGDAGGESLRLRFLQRGTGNASAIDVRIQGASEQGVREIRAEIPALLERLEGAGFRTAASADSGSTMMDERGTSREGTQGRHGTWSGPGQGESGSGHGQGDEQAPSRNPSPGAGEGTTARGRRSPLDFQQALRVLGGAASTDNTEPRGHQEG
jgi:hypothetical protein